MADQNTPVDAAAQSADPTASDRSARRWRLIVLALGGAGALLIIAVIALQVTEYRFYSAPPSVWPRPGAKAVVSAPAAPPTLPITPLTSAVALAAEATATVPAEVVSPAAITTATETATSLESISPTGAAAAAETVVSLTATTAVESTVSAEPVSEATTVPVEGATSALPTAAAQPEVPEIMIGSNEATPLSVEPTPPAVGAGASSASSGGLEVQPVAK